MLNEALVASRTVGGDDRNRAHALLALAYQTAVSVLTKLGETDLAWIAAERGRVLLVHPTYKDTWDVPGGYVERGESPAAACRRELKEELGIDRAPLRLLNVDWAPNDREGDKLLFLFDCGPLGDDEARITLQADELDR